MKDPNGFDDLARQKLAERRFAFDPAHWADMEQLLRERGRKPKAWWPWMAAGALLIGGGALWAGLEQDASSAPAPHMAVVEPVAPRSAPSEQGRPETAIAPAEVASTASREKQHPEQEPKIEHETARTSTTSTKQGSTGVAKSNIPVAALQRSREVTSNVMPTPQVAVPVAHDGGLITATTNVITTTPRTRQVTGADDANNSEGETPDTGDVITSHTSTPVAGSGTTDSQEPLIPAQEPATAEPVAATVVQEPPTIPTSATPDSSTSHEPIAAAAQGRIFFFIST